MRCAECGLYECCMRTPLGGCPNGEKAEPVQIFTAPDTKPWVIDPNKLPPKEQCLDDEQVKMMEAIVFLTNHGWTCITPDGIDVVALKSAAQDLVDAVERYVEPRPGQEFVHRSEVLLKKNALKELLK